MKAGAEQIIGLGAKMGEGWLLTGEMVELNKSGFKNIICTQPFGCLPNHIVGNGHDPQNPRTGSGLQHRRD